MSRTAAATSDPYKIRSIKPSEPPAGVEGTNWYRYEIAQGKNVIRGYRAGSRKSVTSAIEIIVAQLNERRRGKRGRVQFIPTPKSSN